MPHRTGAFAFQNGVIFFGKRGKRTLYFKAVASASSHIVNTHLNQHDAGLLTEQSRCKGPAVIGPLPQAHSWEEVNRRSSRTSRPRCSRHLALTQSASG